MAGKLATSALEQSNVDITSELVGLMTSQRNYQANSKVHVDRERDAAIADASVVYAQR